MRRLLLLFSCLAFCTFPCVLSICLSICPYPHTTDVAGPRLPVAPRISSAGCGVTEVAAPWTDVIPTGRVSFLPKPAQSSIQIPNLADLIARFEDGAQGQFIPCRPVATQFKATALCQHWPSNMRHQSPRASCTPQEGVETPAPVQPTCKLSSPEPASTR